MTFIEKIGDLFTSDAPALGHGVNCKGLMGAGIAIQFRRGYPGMYAEYRKLCVEKLLRPGQIYPYRAGDRTIVNIASQEYPGPDASLRWLELGLSAALEYCVERELAALAIPRIGCGIGGLAWLDAKHVMTEVASSFDTVTLEVWTL